MSRSANAAPAIARLAASSGGGVADQTLFNGDSMVWLHQDAPTRNIVANFPKFDSFYFVQKAALGLATPICTERVTDTNVLILYGNTRNTIALSHRGGITQLIRCYYVDTDFLQVSMTPGRRDRMRLIGAIPEPVRELRARLLDRNSSQKYSAPKILTESFLLDHVEICREYALQFEQRAPHGYSPTDHLGSLVAKYEKDRTGCEPDILDFIGRDADWLIERIRHLAQPQD